MFVSEAVTKVCYAKAVLKNFVKNGRRALVPESISLSLLKRDFFQDVFCEFSKIFKKKFFGKYFWVTTRRDINQYRILLFM